MHAQLCKWTCIAMWQYVEFFMTCKADGYTYECSTCEHQLLIAIAQVSGWIHWVYCPGVSKWYQTASDQVVCWVAIALLHCMLK